jgi:hypothetical protein
LPLIWQGIRGGLKDFSAQRVNASSGARSGDEVPRTDRDLSTRTVLGGIVLLLVLIMLARPLNMNFLGAC